MNLLGWVLDGFQRSLCDIGDENDEKIIATSEW